MKKLLLALLLFSTVCEAQRGRGGSASAAINYTRTKVYATFNSSDKSTHITLSNGNKTATNDGASNNQVRATIGLSKDLWYFEMTFTRNNPSDPWFIPFGLSKISESVESYTGSSDGFCITTDGSKWINGTQTAAWTTAWTDGDVLGVKLNLDAGTCELLRNNTSLGNVATGLVGNYYIATGASFIAGQTTVNFGASAFTYSVPSGYNSGVYYYQ